MFWAMCYWHTFNIINSAPNACCCLTSCLKYIWLFTPEKSKWLTLWTGSKATDVRCQNLCLPVDGMGGTFKALWEYIWVFEPHVQSRDTLALIWKKSHFPTSAASQNSLLASCFFLKVSFVLKVPFSKECQVLHQNQFSSLLKLPSPTLEPASIFRTGWEAFSTENREILAENQSEAKCFNKLTMKTRSDQWGKV